jgi:hypothetical protein
MNIFKHFLATICALSIAVLSFNNSANDEINNEFSQAELEQILAPIALYPDSLLTHILIASTYPLEIIQAQRWLQHHKNYNANDIADGVENKNWDASVKALMPFPRVIKRLNDDLDWTQKLGDAFLQDEQQVLASIQILRRKADQAGNLDQMDNMDVVREEKTIIIKSVHPDVVYVPYYDSRYVYGDWYWYNYPPVYWTIAHNHHHYYRGYNSLFYWNAGVTISFNYFFNAFHWRDHRIVVVDHYRPHYRTSYSYGYKINHHKTRAWRHNPSHRRGVAYHNNVVKKRYQKHYNGQRVSVSHKQNPQVTRSGGYPHKSYQHSSYNSGYKSIHAKLQAQNNTIVRNKTTVSSTANGHYIKGDKIVNRTHKVIKKPIGKIGNNRVVNPQEHTIKRVKNLKNNNHKQVKLINHSQIKRTHISQNKVNKSTTTRTSNKSSYRATPKYSHRSHGLNKNGRHQQRD